MSTVQSGTSSGTTFTLATLKPMPTAGGTTPSTGGASASKQLQSQSVFTPSGKEMTIISAVPKPASVQYVQAIPTAALQVLGNTPNRLSRPPPTQAKTPGSGGMKRPLEYDFSMNVRKFPRSTDKSKGLRHFSTKVCEKVREKVVTNYNEVADELVQEYFESMPNPPASQEKQIYDQKNIRRRVYDALNVLMAMNIISKEKKEIRWVGLPTSSVQECKKLEDEKTRRLERIRQKTEQLQDLIIQLVAFKSLVERNKDHERQHGKPMPNSTLFLPYIIIHTDKRTVVDCSISSDKTEYMFTFDRPFEIHDDVEVLKRLGLTHGLDRGHVDPTDVPKLKTYLPPALRDYIDQIVQNRLFSKFPPVQQSFHSHYSSVGHRVPIAPGLGTAERLYARPLPRESTNMPSADAAADMEVAMTFSPGQGMIESGSGLGKGHQQMVVIMPHQRIGSKGHYQMGGRHPLPHHSYYSLGHGGRGHVMRGAVMRGRAMEEGEAMYDEEEEVSRSSYGSDDVAGGAY